MLKNILDNYFTDNLIKEIKREIKMKYLLDLKVEYEKNKMKLFNNNPYTRVIISAKPKYYKNYTRIFSFVKGDAFNNLTYLRCSNMSFILEELRDIDQNDYWVK